ncbi:MAG: 1-(5-phosphoribosyl)-5-[(5-phosphoribosylamino)methylideneamino] imidazole-4-carboxamide isomerase [Gemmatimonadetes bacterium]|nr:MAG: 1-(5-phosphoribosyl)-5-[(5-phosphoribosylamino)methylideneamino] imidazole-4-carboxamide isomerase [Gemmatimonadota bacterium]
MIALPAIDLRGGRCVQLVGGRPETERVSLPDPLAVADRWWATGFRELHVVDLDAALGRGTNRAVVAALLAQWPGRVQVGGGVRDERALAELLEAGAERVVVGTRAVEDPDWLAAAAAAYPGRLVVAADVREGRVVTRGWTEAIALDAETLFTRLAPLPLAGVLVTDVDREGRAGGIDREAATRLTGACPHPLIASGGVRDMDDLDALDQAGAHGVVLGMALYTDLLDATAVAARWGGSDGKENGR